MLVHKVSLLGSVLVAIGIWCSYDMLSFTTNSPPSLSAYTEVTGRLVTLERSVREVIKHLYKLDRTVQRNEIAIVESRQKTTSPPSLSASDVTEHLSASMFRSRKRLCQTLIRWELP